ncbi:MAG TPA: serine/threonine-protein kinase [Gemmataceae bacterium]|nr:serine/threonine-protein kinase [Gemmataceae bacterium]
MSNAPDDALPNRTAAGDAETEPLPPLVLPADAPTLVPAGTDPAAAGPATCPVVPGYQILSEVGRGGMGVVYQARQEGLDRLVALKMILAGSHAGPEHRSRFDAEARAIARLRHPNVVQIYQVGEHEGKPFLALEFVAGGNLAQALEGKPWPAERAAAFVAKLADALRAVHAEGIVHRDLKPGNVLLDADGEPKITDFGLAKRLEGATAGLTATGIILGTPSYMAPEQTGGRSREVGPAADVYSLGAILYELLTGRPPFLAETSLDTMLLVASEEPTAPRKICPAVPADLEKVCLKCLAKRIDERYPTAAALTDDLRRFCAGEPVSARPPGLLRRFGKWREKHPGTAVALAIAFAIWLAFFALMALMRNFVSAPTFALVLLLFVRPTWKTLAVGAAVLLVFCLLQWAVLLRGAGLWGVPIGLALIGAQGLVPAVLIGTVGRVVAWVMRRDAVATTLGAYFGSLLGGLCACGGVPIIFAISMGQENVQKFQEFSQKFSAQAQQAQKQAQTKQPSNAQVMSEEEILAFFRQFDYTWPLVFSISWALLSSLLPTTLGAFLGGAATGRKAVRGPGSDFPAPTLSGR